MTKSPLMKYDPTITLGNWITMGGFLLSAGIAWGSVNARIDAQSVAATEQRREFTSAVNDLRDSQREQRLEMKDLQRSVNAITADTALIRGRLASNDQPGPRK